VRNRKERATNLLWAAAGFGLLWLSWDTWQNFALLEAGQRATMKVWAPIAALYNFGGIWTTVAKCAFVLIFSLSGLSLILFCGGAALFPEREPDAARQTVRTPQPATPVDSTRYDVSYDLEVTPAQIAREEEIIIAGPNGRFAVKLNKKFRNGRLRFAHEGREHIGDLYVNLRIREA
jgi:hypothetical protein